MAITNTQTVYAPASSKYPYQITISFAETEVDKTNNTSKLTITGAIYGKNINYAGSNSTLAIYWFDDHEKVNGRHITTKTIPSTVKGEPENVSANITVNHKPDGSLNGYARVVFTKVGSNTYVPPSTTVDTAVTALTWIPRGSVLGNISDFTIGNSIDIPITKYVDSYVDTLEISLNNTVIKTVSGITNGYDVSFTEAELNRIYDLTPKTNGTFIFKLTTTSGGAIIGTPSTKTAIGTINTSIMKPTIPTYTTEEVGDVPDTWGVFVKNKSKIKFNISSTPSRGSTITEIKTTIGGVTYTGTEIETDYLKNAGENLVIIRATDSRGVTNGDIYRINVVDYDLPYITSATAVRSDKDGNADDNGTYLRVDLVAGVSLIENNNTATYQVLYKKTTAPEYTEYTINSSDLTYNNSVKISELDTNSSYDVKIVVKDYFSESGKVLPTVPTAFTTVDYKSGGKGVAMGKVAEEDDLLDVAFNLKVHQDVEVLGNINIDGVNLFNLIYPIGSIYMSMNETSPKILFGGEWEQIKGRFLLGTGTPSANTDNYFGAMSGRTWNAGAGSTGGEDYHTLTIAEMPSHNHSVHLSGTDYTNSTANQNYSIESAYRLYDGEDLAGSVVGGDSPFSKMPPYLAVYMWKRIA